MFTLLMKYCSLFGGTVWCDWHLTKYTLLIFYWCWLIYIYIWGSINWRVWCLTSSLGVQEFRSLCCILFVCINLLLVFLFLPSPQLGLERGSHHSLHSVFSLSLFLLILSASFIILLLFPSRLHAPIICFIPKRSLHPERILIFFFATPY